MEPQVNRDSMTMSPPDPAVAGQPVRVVEQTAVERPTFDQPLVAPDPPVAPAAVVAEPLHAVERVESISTFAPHAVAAGLLAVAMLVWGGVVMARAGFDGELRDPVVEVFGLAGNAISGAIVAGIGVLLLIAAVSRDRGPVVFTTIVAGVASVIVALEPDVADGALGVEAELPALIAVGCAIVLLTALALPTVNRRRRTVDAY